VIHRVGELDTSENPEHERREQAVQRAGWGAMALFVAAAVAGLFGSGPLARTTARVGGLEVEYPRFMRREAPAEVRVHVAPGVPAQLWLGREVLDELDIEAVTPEPARVTAEADRLLYRYDAAPSEVVLKLRPTHSGRASLRLGVVGGEEAELSPLVYP